MTIRKIFSLLGEGGDIIGYEIKDNTGKTQKFKYKVDEYYDEKFNFSHTEEVETNDFIDFWLFMFEKYPLYRFYPAFIADEYKKVIKNDFTMVIFKNDAYSDMQKERWLKFFGESLSDFRSFEELAPDEVWDDTPGIEAAEKLKLTEWYQI